MRLVVVFASVAVLVAVLAAAPASAAAPTRDCGFVSFTANSGDGLFQIRVRYVSCTTARAKLRATRGDPSALRGWRCRRISTDEFTGSGRYACTSRARVHGVLRTRLIAFTTGN